MRSLRAEAEARLGGQLRWEQGWRGGVWNPFWQAHPEHYPFRDANGHISLRAFMDNLRWPHMIRLPARPDDAWTDYSENVQGLAPYVSSSGRLFWVLARKKLLGAPDGRGYITILDAQEDPNHEDAIVFDKLFTDAGLRAEDFYHYGDPAVDGEYILIPMEGGVRPKLLIFRVIEDDQGEPVDVKFVIDEEMSSQEDSPAEAPWVAVFNGLIFSSYFKGYPVRPAHGAESSTHGIAKERSWGPLTMSSSSLRRTAQPQTCGGGKAVTSRQAGGCSWPRIEARARVAVFISLT